jgi:hypothetical protein
MAQVAIKGNNFLFPTKVKGYYFVVVVNSPLWNNGVIRKLLGWTWTLHVWFSAEKLEESLEVSTYLREMVAK